MNQNIALPGCLEKRDLNQLQRCEKSASPWDNVHAPTAAPMHQYEKGAFAASVRLFAAIFSGIPVYRKDAAAGRSPPG